MAKKDDHKIAILNKTQDAFHGEVYVPVCLEEGGYTLLNLENMKMGDKIYPSIKSIRKEFADEDKWFIKDKDFAWDCRIMWVMNRTI